MTDAIAPHTSRWTDAVLAARVLAIDPVALGGVVVRAQCGPVRDAWMALFKSCSRQDRSWRRIPINVSEGRLVGGLDLAATLSAGKPVAEKGLLAECDGGIAVLPSAERAEKSTLTAIAGALDEGCIRLERDGLAAVKPARFAVIAYDESRSDEERPAAMLCDRLAIEIDLEGIPFAVARDAQSEQFDLPAARLRVAGIGCSENDVEALCATAAALGILSLRAPLHALRVARAVAALEGREALQPSDLEAAVRLALVARATQVPATAEPPSPPPAEDPPPVEPDVNEGTSVPSEAELEEMLLAAARAALPPGLLEKLQRGLGAARAKGASGRAGHMKKSAQLRGRRAGTRRGDPRTGARLDILETIRSAAPWQALRRNDRAVARLTARVEPGDPALERVHKRLDIRRDDFRLRRFKHQSETATIFVVDASGSAALHRLAEAKGAVELLLADCYARRDHVALIAFRGTTADLLLPPTRSLVRAKRCLAGLPGGGGTPLAAATDQACALGQAARRKGQTPTIVFLTDGRANIDRRGSPGRAAALTDAGTAAKSLRAEGIAAIVIDTSARPSEQSEQFAGAMGATYLPLPHADAAALSSAVRHVVA